MGHIFRQSVMNYFVMTIILKITLVKMEISPKKTLTKTKKDHWE
jgi:hypothetical protein